MATQNRLFGHAAPQSIGAAAGVPPSPAAGTRAAVIAVAAGAPTHTVDRMYMGCHSDSGFGPSSPRPSSNSTQVPSTC